MAQNFINYFETESLYNSAKSGLSNPNVSLVNESGNLHYTKHTYGLAASELGDIILEDSTKMYSVNPDNYNLTDFPLATYTPIGITVIPGSETPNGMARVLSLKYLDRTPGHGIYFDNWLAGSNNNLSWGLNVDDSENYQDIRSELLLNGKENTQYIINNRQTADWSGSSIPYSPSDGHYPMFCFASRYHTAVTQEGDWYVPSIKELRYTLSNNRSYFKYSFERISAIAGTQISFATSFVFDQTKGILSSTENYYGSGTRLSVLQSDNGSIQSYNKTYAGTLIPMLQIGVEEV